MTKIIKLTMYPFGHPVAFETTGIKIVCTSQDGTDRAIVNGTTVEESFNEILFLLTKKIRS